jgi:hypothetical protein
MLDRAAAADAEMRTERRDPLCAGDLDLEQPPPVGMMAGDRPDFDRFAAERIRHIDVAAACDSHAVAVVADMVDHEELGVSHGARP